MIKYNDSNINDWNFGDDNIIKVYRNNAVCYYKVTSGDTPTPVQEPCFAVVDDISQYSDTEFEDVYDKATEKWYKLNNLNQYEQYGIYGSGRTSCEGSRLPQGYTEVEYIENTASVQNVQRTSFLSIAFADSVTDNASAYTYTVTFESTEYPQTYNCLFGNSYIKSQPLGNNYNRISVKFVKYGGDTATGGVVVGKKYETKIYWNEGESYPKIEVKDITAGTTTTTTFNTNEWLTNNSNRIGLFNLYNVHDTGAYTSKAKIYEVKIEDRQGNLVAHAVPCTRDADGKVGFYNLVRNEFEYDQSGQLSLVAGDPITPTDCVTTYNGKLTIDDGYEYIYSGGSWINLGEVSGSTIIIKSPEYIEKDSSHNGKINLDYVWKTNSKMQFKFYSTNNGGGAMIGEDGMPDNNDCRMFFASTTAYFDWGSSRIQWGSNGQKNTLYEYEYGNYYIKNMVTSTSKTSSTISSSRTNTLYLGLGGTDRFRTYYLKFYDGDTLVKDFIPWTDMNGNYGLYDKVSLSVYNVASGTLTGSSNVTDVEVGGGYEYPLEYVVREDPPDNLVFSSMAEAEEYECPWYGMSATIGAEDYMFCEGNEWLTKYSYVEVSGEYICDNGDKYKKMQEYDRQADGTFSPSSNYVKGDLIESGSPDCQNICLYNFCGVNANGGDVIINNGTTTLTQSNWTSPYPVVGIVGDATEIIGMYCFRNPSTTLSALTIGNTVTTIEHEAFMETVLLTTLTIPSSVTQIDFWAFTRCNGLQEVIFEGTTPPTFTNQNSGVFHDYCPPVIYVPDSALSAYRAISASVWTNQSFDVNTRIKGISERS